MVSSYFLWLCHSVVIESDNVGLSLEMVQGGTGVELTVSDRVWSSLE